MVAQPAQSRGEQNATIIIMHSLGVRLSLTSQQTHPSQTIMDVILPGHSLRTFAASISCLSKIGKELYLDFDPLDGLVLRTLNDAKSAYASVTFTPAFFERCSAPPRPVKAAARERREGGIRGGREGGGRQRGHRKRSRSTSHHRSASSSGHDSSSSDANDNDNDHEEEDDGDTRFLCRVSLRSIHSVLRSRKNVTTLRIRSLGTSALAGPTQQTQTQSQGEGSQENAAQDDGGDDGQSGARMQLSFEFWAESLPTKPKHSGPTGTLKIVHRLHVSDARGVMATATRRSASEVVVRPSTFLRLLDPLKRTTEVALTVDDGGRTVTATSFHHGDAVAGAAAAVAGRGGGSSNGGGTGGNGREGREEREGRENAVLNAAAAAVLKTETSIGVEEFEEYHFRDDRNLSGTDGGGDGGSQDGEEELDDHGGVPPPSRVNEEVTLVFSIKEAKAMLQFCSQASHDVEMDAVLSFHWGGRPFVLEAEEESGAYRSELILATLNHRLLGRGVRQTKGGGGGGGRSASASGAASGAAAASGSGRR